MTRAGAAGRPIARLNGALTPQRGVPTREYRLNRA